MDIEKLRQGQQLEWYFPGVQVSAEHPYLGPVPIHSPVCQAPRLKYAQSSSRHCIPWPCCGHRLQTRCGFLSRVGRDRPVFRPSVANKLRHLLLQRRGPGVVILNFLGRETASILFGSLWATARFDCWLPDFTELNWSVVKLEQTPPVIAYDWPVQRVLCITQELTNFISRHVQFQRLVSVIIDDVYGKVHTALYSLRSTGNGSVMSGDGAPESESSANGCWYESRTMTECWQAQFRHRKTHHWYYRQWSLIMSVCGGIGDRTDYLFTQLKKDVYASMFPHNVNSTVLGSIVLAAAAALSPVWYSRDPHNRRHARFEGAFALQQSMVACFPPLYYDSRPCLVCPIAEEEWARMSDWVDNNRISWAQVHEANQSAGGIPNTVWGDAGPTGITQVWGHPDDTPPTATAENNEDGGWVTASSHVDPTADTTFPDPAFENGGCGVDPYPEQEDSDDRHQAYLERDDHWPSPPDAKLPDDYDTTDTEADVGSHTNPIEVSDDEVEMSIRGSAREARRFLRNARSANCASPERLLEALGEGITAFDDVVYETDIDDEDDGHGRADTGDCNDSPFD